MLRAQCACEHGRDCETGDGMDAMGYEFGEWDEDEEAFGQGGVGEG